MSVQLGPHLIPSAKMLPFSHKKAGAVNSTQDITVRNAAQVRVYLTKRDEICFPTLLRVTL
jgi:hypothetical protein